jgi:hypothetical protein
MSLLEDRDLVGLGRDARAWLLDDRQVARRGQEIARRGREARAWLTHDERRRVIGLFLFSIAISIAMSLLATAIVGFVSRRRAAAPADEVPVAVPDETAAADDTRVGVPVMGGEATLAVVEAPAEA